MIKIDNNEYRNLEEQVQYLTNFHNVNKGLVEWGIRVVGQVNSAEDLPDPNEYSGEYGSAYAVGSSAPYNFYIWTRQAVGSGGYWFPFGNISIAGPQGPKGDKGDKGDQGIRGSQWFSGNGQPSPINIDPKYNVGDYYINVATGNIWHLHEINDVKTWLLEGNIRGPQGVQGSQGIQGEKGETGPRGERGIPGPAGPMIQIFGEINSIDQLPDPTTVSRNAAYVIPSGDAFEVYAIVGPEDNLSWMNLGYIGSTLISDNGTYISEFDVSTKLDITNEGSKIYGTDRLGNQKLYTVGTTALQAVDVAFDIPQRRANGAIIVPDPDYGTDPQANPNTKGQYATNLRTVERLIANIDATNINKLTFGKGTNNADLTITGGTTDKTFISEVVHDVFGDNPAIDLILNSPLVTLNPSIAAAPLSIALGADNESLASGAVTFGYDNINSGWCSTGIGAMNNISGASSLTYGYKNTLTNDFTTAIGTENEISGKGGTAIGNLCKVSGKRAFAAGNECEAKAEYSMALGGECIVETAGIRGFACGNNTKVTGKYGFACGSWTEAGQFAHSEGDSTHATGDNAHAEGWNTYATAESAHSEGTNTQATHKNSHAGGYGTKTSAENQTVIGKYNDPISNAIFIVGNGGSDKARSNAFTVLENGTAYLGDEKVLTRTEWQEIAVDDTGYVTLNITLNADYEFCADVTFEGTSYRVMLGNLHFNAGDVSGNIVGNLSAPFGSQSLYLTYNVDTKQIFTKVVTLGQTQQNLLHSYTMYYRRIHE